MLTFPMNMLPTIEELVRVQLSAAHVDAEKLAGAVVVESFKARTLGVEGGWHVFAIGSRAMYRTWGLWGPRAYKRLPLLVRLRVERGESGSGVLFIRLVNDDGFYVVRLPAAETAYRRAFREIVAKIQATFC